MSSPKRRIGLTMRTVEADGYIEPRDALAQLWPQFMKAALPDADWMYVPNMGATDSVNFCNRWGVNGLVLTGGEDVGSSPLRDETESALLRWAFDHAHPVLGVCRGLQLMVTNAGGSLGKIDGHVATRHALSGDYAWDVNSYHSASVESLPASYRVLAKASDGSIEAVRHDTLPREGWMWHPEREAPYSSDDIREVRRIFR